MNPTFVSESSYVITVHFENTGEQSFVVSRLTLKPCSVGCGRSVIHIPYLIRYPLV